MPPPADNVSLDLGSEPNLASEPAEAQLPVAQPRRPLRWIVRNVMRLYGRLPMPAGLRGELREGLRRALPSLFNRISRTINDAPPARPEETEILAGAAFRQGLWRMMRDIGAHAERFGPVTHVIALPFFATGGSEATAASFARTLGDSGRRSVLMLATDRAYRGARLPAPPGALMLDLSDYFQEAALAARDAIVFAILRAVSPETLHIINSSAAWRLVVEQGERVARICRVFGSIFCLQVNSATGEYEGYAHDYMKRALPHLDALLSDNASFFDLAEEAFGASGHRDKYVTVYNVAPPWPPATLREVDARLDALVAAIATTDRLQVLWAGRLDQEKRPDLMIAAARARPDIDFHIYGSKIVGEDSPFSTADLPNIHLHKPYTSPADAARARLHHLMMFTSRWEGMPNVLLEFGSLGVPVVATTLGGVSELIDEATGYPLGGDPNVAQYLAAFDRIRADPQAAVVRARELRRRIAERHTRANFEATIRAIPHYLEAAPAQDKTS